MKLEYSVIIQDRVPNREHYLNAGKNDRVPNREHHWIDRDRERGREGKEKEAMENRSESRREHYRRAKGRQTKDIQILFE